MGAGEGEATVHEQQKGDCTMMTVQDKRIDVQFFLFSPADVRESWTMKRFEEKSFAKAIKRLLLSRFT